MDLSRQRQRCRGNVLKAVCFLQGQRAFFPLPNRIMPLPPHLMRHEKLTWKVFQGLYFSILAVTVISTFLPMRSISKTTFPITNSQTPRSNRQFPKSNFLPKLWISLRFSVYSLVN